MHRACVGCGSRVPRLGWRGSLDPPPDRGVGGGPRTAAAAGPGATELAEGRRGARRCEGRLPAAVRVAAGRQRQGTARSGMGTAGLRGRRAQEDRRLVPRAVKMMNELLLAGVVLGGGFAAVELVRRM